MVAATPTASNWVPTISATPASAPQMGRPVQTSKGDPTPPAHTVSGDPKNGSGKDAKDPKPSSPLPHDPKDPSESRASTEFVIDPDARTFPNIRVSSLRLHSGEEEATEVTKSILVSSIAAILNPYLGHGKPVSSLIADSGSEIDNTRDAAAAAASSRNSHVQDGGPFDPQNPGADAARVQSAMPDATSNAASSQRQADNSAFESLISSPENSNGNAFAGDSHASSMPAGATVIPFSQDSTFDNPKLSNHRFSEAGSSDSNPSTAKLADPNSVFDSTAMLGEPLSGAFITGSATTFTAYQLGASGKVVIPNGLKWDTLSVDGSAATIGGHTISAASDGVVVGSSTQSFSNIISPFSGLSHQSEVATLLGSSSVVPQPGSVATLLNGQILSAASDGLLSGSVSLPLGTHLRAESATQLIAPFTISGVVYTAFENSAGHHEEATILMDGTSITLLPGGAATTFDGQALSAGAEGLIVGTYTVPYSRALSDAQLLAPFTISGETYTAFQTARGAFIPLSSDSMTLLLSGSLVTLNGKILSVATNGVVVGGSTNAWITETSLDIGAFASDTTLPIAELAASFTVSGTTYTAVETSIPGHGEMVVISVKSGRVALWPGGPAATVDGEAVSAATRGLVIGGVTETMSTVTDTSKDPPVATSTSSEFSNGASGGKSSESLRGGAADSGSGKLELPWRWLMERIF